jgi:hypothetical protein
MTYGLRALRATLLGGASIQGVASDFMVLCLFVALLVPVSVVALHFSLRYARGAGTLAYA